MTNYSYNNSGAIIASDGWVIPPDPRNGDYAALKAAEARGEIAIAPYVAPPAPPETIKTAYLKAAMAQIGKLAAVDAAVTDPVLAVLWANATEMRRDDPDMAAIARGLSIDLDDLWTRARAIRAARGQA